MRQFTPQDLKIIEEAELKLRETGKVLITEEEADAAHNAERLIAFFNHNSTLPVTIATVLEAFRMMGDQLRFKPRVQVEYENEYNALSQVDKDTFGAWWFSSSTKKTIVIDGDQGYSNAAKIIGWMKGKPFTPRNLDLAVSNLAGSRGSLYWAPTPKRTDPRQHQDDGQGFMPKSETNLSSRDHAAARRTDSAASDSQQVETDYRALAESIKTGRTHSDSAMLARLFVMQKDSPLEIDWKATYTRRQAFADGKARR
jgi:hypothetical protein